MAEKRALDEPEPEPKRVATSTRLFESMASYRTLLEHCGQTLAARLYCGQEDHYDAIDEWVRAQSPEIIGRAILNMLPQYDATQAIVASVLRAFPTVWTTPINGESFVWRLYSSECGVAGKLEPLIIEHCTTEIANYADSDGNTMLFYATELMHVSVVEYLLLKLHCDVPVNKHGHHALFAPLVNASVEFEPMQKIIRAFLHARQRRPNIFNPTWCVNGVTVLGWLLKYPYPELVRTWLKRREADEWLTPKIRIDHVKVGDKVDGVGTITSDNVSLFAEFDRCKLRADVLEARKANDSGFFKQLILDGVSNSTWRQCDQSDHVSTFAGLAITLNNAELLELSITHFGEVERSCVCGNARRTLIMRTIDFHAPNLFTILVNHGAKIDLSSRVTVESPMIQMVGIPEFHEIWASLLPAVDLNTVYVPDLSGRSKLCCFQPITLLDAALMSKNHLFVSTLLAHGVRPSVLLPYNELYAAISTGNIAFVDLMLEHGAIPSIIHLMLAVSSKYVDIFERLRPLVCTATDLFERIANAPTSLLTCDFCTHPPKQTLPLHSAQNN
jgi:hypothetical protein